MSNFKVGLFSALDVRRFKNMKKRRERVISKTRPKKINGNFKINKHAKELHPDFQELIVDRIEDYLDGETKSYYLRSPAKKTLAYFRAGQALSLKLQIGNSYVTRSYSISSSPKEAKDGSYRITVKRKENGFVSDYIFNNFRTGTRVVTSEPYGNFYLEKLRDKKNILAIAGGIGITPFVSMAHAIRDGLEDFNLTILYACKDYDSILFKEELNRIQTVCEKVKVVCVLSDEEREGFERGIITTDLISKYATDPCSIFVSGPKDMLDYVSFEIDRLRKPIKEVRYDVISCEADITTGYNYPKEVTGNTFKIKVIQGPDITIIDALSNESILVALEKAGIKAPSKCRGGECGFCRSKLYTGHIYTNRTVDQRRYTDIEFNYIHPCCCYPVADCTIEIPSEYY